MSIHQGKRTYNKYPYSHNQLSADNPFRYMGTSYNPYLPKVSNPPEKYESNQNMNKQSSSPYEKKEKPYNRNSSTSLINNSYNIINYDSHNKRNFGSFRNNKDHVAELFNYPNNEERKKNKTPYSVYTVSNQRLKRTQQNNNQNNELSNEIPIIDDIENKVKNMDKFNDIDINKDINKNNNNLFNSQRVPKKYFDNINNYDHDKRINKTEQIYNNKNNNFFYNDNNNELAKEKISDINTSEYFDENCSLIKSFVYKENPNRGYRDYMEDKSRVVQNINGDRNSHLFCLFDGHGGANVSQYLQENFHKYFKDILPLSNPQKNFKELFSTVDNKIKDLNLLNMGATACIIYITKENGKKVLYSANIGDTRSLLISSNDYKRLSYDHRATDSNEYNRIIKNGGIVFAGRVYGSLMLSRAFGDWELKSYGVVSEPHVTKIYINDNDKYVIVATDGIWDTLEDGDVYNISKNMENARDLCNTLVEKAMEKGSMDNISCFVIKLN